MLRCSIKDEYSYMESTSPPFGSELLELSRVPIKGERDSSTFSGDIPDSHSQQVWILFLRALTLPSPRKHQATRNFGGAIKHQNHISEHNFPNFDTIRIFASSGKRSNRLIPGDSIDQPFFNNGNNLRTTGSGVDEGDQQRLLIWQLTIAVGGGEPESLSLSVWFTIWPSLLPVSPPSPPTLSPSLPLSLSLSSFEERGKEREKRKELAEKWTKGKSFSLFNVSHFSHIRWPPKTPFFPANPRIISMIYESFWFESVSSQWDSDGDQLNLSF